MAGRTERDTMNNLIEICRDGARGFRLAADYVADPQLKGIFSDTARQRDLFAAELLPYAHCLGGALGSAGTTRGTLHRGWMMVKDTLTGHDECAVLAEARRGEAVAADVYADAIMSLLPPNARPIIERQYRAIRGVQHELDQLTLPVA